MTFPTWFLLLKSISQQRKDAGILTMRYSEILDLVNHSSIFKTKIHYLPTPIFYMYESLNCNRKRYLHREWRKILLHRTDAGCSYGNNYEQINVSGLHIFLKYSTMKRFQIRFSTTCNCADCIRVEKSTQCIFHELLNNWEETRSCQRTIILLKLKGQIF